MSDPKFEILIPDCSVDGCSEKANFGFGRKCAFHDVLTSARNLKPEAFDRLRSTLETTPPLSEGERRANRVKSALWNIEWSARDLKRHKRHAKNAGATKSQIADAARRGRSKA